MISERLRVVSALGVVQIFSWGTSYYLLAVISTPLRAETGWSVSLVTAGISLALLTSALAAVFVGRMIQASGGRRVMAGGMGLLALGLTMIATAHHPAVYLGAWLFMGLGMGAGLYEAGFATLGRIYGSEARGPISALTLWGGFASTVCWPLSAVLIDWVGWRGACLSYAAIHLFVTAPLCLFALPRGVKPIPGATPVADGTPPVSVLQDPRFWLFGIAMMVTASIGAFWSTHLITILSAQGMSLAAAVALGAVIGPAQVAARVGEVLGRGRNHPIWTMLTYAICAVVGMGGLWLGIPAMLAFIAYGMGNGLWSITRGAMPLAMFGPDRYARIVGMLALPTFSASALAPLVGGALIDRFGAAGAVPVSALLALIPLAAALILVRGHVRQRPGVVR
ncbi:MFS transporter [Pseudooceanicola sp.]|uniref:MFS transporter n=1 Tax=Pseudooceanicola sp. TaxID=1914328 RepID=UPI00262D281C|nr:MFS transporter [Pseudooceanicola sp.]MDF1856743.1 MFS transporter [Pseudooceanicola sp.]